MGLLCSWPAWEPGRSERKGSERKPEEWWAVRRPHRALRHENEGLDCEWPWPPDWSASHCNQWRGFWGVGGASDAVIVRKEETTDSNPWENVEHNVSLLLGDAGQPLCRFFGLSVCLKPFGEHEYASRQWFKAKPAQFEVKRRYFDDKLQAAGSTIALTSVLGPPAEQTTGHMPTTTCRHQFFSSFILVLVLSLQYQCITLYEQVKG